MIANNVYRLFLIFCLSANTAFSEERRYNINLSTQNVAEALNRLSEQTDVQVLFPYDIAVATKGNTVKGQYTLQQSLDKLLSGTVLSGGLSQKGVLVVSKKKPDENNNERTARMNSMKAKKNVLATVISFFIGAGAQGVIGQEALAQEHEDFPNLLEEIVVTATRRETTLQDTAMSISNISGDFLIDHGIVQLDEIISTVPGVTLALVGPGRTTVVMRGISTSGFGGGTVGGYLDDTPLAGTTAAFSQFDLRLVDMSRVEVLKGPQGTLFGKSAMGGIIRYITNKPEFEKFSGHIAGGYSNTRSGGSNFSGDAHVNIPLHDNVAIRVVGYRYDNDGFIDADGGDHADNVNTDLTQGGRFALKWEVDEETKVNLLYLNQSMEVGDVQDITSTFTPFPYTLGVSPPDLKAPSTSNLTKQYDNGTFYLTTEIMSLKLAREFSAFNMELMGSKSQVTVKNNPFYSNLFVDMTDARVRFNDSKQNDVDTFEFRLQSSEREAFFEWTVGLWYENGNAWNDYVADVDGPDLLLYGFLPLSDGEVIQDVRTTFDASEKAIYADLILHLADQWVLNLGYRRSEMKTKFSVLRANGVFDTVFQGLDQRIGNDESVQEDVNNYRVSLDYALNDDILLYATAASGYRLGGFNAASTLHNASTYDSDSIWDYELGVKTAWLDGRLTVNGSLYQINWEDIQLGIFDFGDFSLHTRNVGEAQIEGLDLEAKYFIKRDLSIAFNYAFTDAILGVDYPTGNAFKGDRLPGSSRESYSLFLDWSRALTPEINLDTHFVYRYIGNSRSGFNSITAPINPSYESTDVRVSMTHDDSLSVSLFANNLFNKIGQTGYGAQGNYVQAFSVTRPRTMGLQVRYQF